MVIRFQINTKKCRKTHDMPKLTGEIFANIKLSGTMIWHGI